jgi:hypothetical protein
MHCRVCLRESALSGPMRCMWCRRLITGYKR